MLKYMRGLKAAGDETESSATKMLAAKQLASSPGTSIAWTQKYRPKAIIGIIGNEMEQIQHWLKNWDEHFLKAASKGKGKIQNDSGAKKAVMLSGMPGIGKTTSAKLVSQWLAFQTIEVNASDIRGKADSKIKEGIGGSTANSIKECVTNEFLSANIGRSHRQKTVLIIDEVDGMSAGDGGGVADLIAVIKISKIPIICICNDRYSQELKSLMNYCLPIDFRKPAKQQMAKRLKQVANAEGIQVSEIALEELADRVDGDMRMALNQLQYTSLAKSQHLLSRSKDEDISPFKAIEKLFDFNAKNLKIDQRIDLSMSDPDLVPLLVQENYLNYKPSSASKDDSDLKRISLIARAADSIADSDLINVQIGRYQQRQLSPAGCISSCIIPASLLHGQRKILEQVCWLDRQNSTMGKNYRNLEDLHIHLLSSGGLASRKSHLGRENLRLDYFTLLGKKLTDPLRVLPKDEAVKNVVDFKDSYSISQEDFDNIVELSKFKGCPTLLDGVRPDVKAALTKAYNQGSKSNVIRSTDLITLPGIKKDFKNSSDTEDTADVEKKLQSDRLCLSWKGFQVNTDWWLEAFAGSGSSNGSDKGSTESSGERGGRGSGAAAKRKR
ncbi:Replication factor C subunit 1 [Capsicum baccatum]|uniref:Replication factor C subunit 1 n=1 Tax=Capsicum baccatum TaxID=33114 RepID=A0A2G2X1T0_CAPBA|nr:Replication factor C subunit 1 [Capsicum baccatum]